LTATSPSLVVPVRRRCRGFTLVELLAVIAIIGVLIGMLLPAVQRARESGRQTTCTNNLKNMAVALCSYESSRKAFPPGANCVPVGTTLPNGTQHAWSSYILPYIEEGELAARIDYAKRWDAAGANATAAMQDIKTYVCPSGIVPFRGKQDYAGIFGSLIMVTATSSPWSEGSTNGILIPTTADHVRSVKAADITDGLSATVLVGESTDRGFVDGPGVSIDENMRWANGANSFAQSERFVNEQNNGNMRSNHPVGCHAAFADGRVMFLSDMMDPAILSAICTRNGGEQAASLVNRQ
jgi:prepilin-type N-terminal cleavage/methylation domain-containing protein